MTHFAAAVFSDSPTYSAFCNLLEPYDENNEDFYIFEPTSDEELDKQWERFKEFNPSWTRSMWLKEMFTKRADVYGHFYNPQGYYDYYSLDGKEYMYDLLPDVNEDDVDRWPLKSQLNWYEKDQNEKTEKQLRKEWRKYSVEGDGFWSAEFYQERYGGEETYVRQCMYPPMPHAFITPDGKWHSSGRVGWFCSSDDTAESVDQYYAEWRDFIDNAPDCYVSLIDCHI